jgi:transposase InsO family protein
VVQVGVTREPSRAWVARQLRNATPFGDGPRFILRDRDDKFGPDFDRAAQAIGVRVLETPVRAPRANGVCERLLGSVRREYLDHILVLGEQHLQATLVEHCRYFNEARPHQGINQRVPGCSVSTPRGNGLVVATAYLNGLHHSYRRAA